MFWRLLQTKTFWVGLSSIASGIALICAGQVPEGVPLIVAGLGMICIRDAIARAIAKPPKDQQ